MYTFYNKSLHIKSFYMCFRTDTHTVTTKNKYVLHYRVKRHTIGNLEVKLQFTY